MSHYKVYLVDYIGVPGSDDHRVIFVAMSGTSDEPKGPIFHVVGPTIDPKAKRAIMKYETKVLDKPPFGSASFKSKVFIGNIAADKVADLERIAEGVDAPTRGMKQQRPNCVTWISNVLYRLNKENVIEFEESFNVPTEEQSLVG